MLSLWLWTGVLSSSLASFSSSSHRGKRSLLPLRRLRPRKRVLRTPKPQKCFKLSSAISGRAQRIGAMANPRNKSSQASLDIQSCFFRVTLIQHATKARDPASKHNVSCCTVYHLVFHRSWYQDAASRK